MPRTPDVVIVPTRPTNESSAIEPKYSLFAEMSATYGVLHRTLRFYEEIGLLCPKRRGNFRLYTIIDRIWMRLILKARRLGFSLSEVLLTINNNLQYQLESCEEVDILACLDAGKIVDQLRLLERRKEEIEQALDCLRAALRKDCTDSDYDLGAFVGSRVG